MKVDRDQQTFSEQYRKKTVALIANVSQSLQPKYIVFISIFLYLSHNFCF